MILPTIRASFHRDEALHLVDLVGRDDPELRARARQRLEEEGMDALLDDPRVLNAILTGSGVKASPPLVFYVLVRHALLEGGIDNVGTADYVTALLLAFSRGRRAFRVSDHTREEFHYLIDLASRMEESGEPEAFHFASHLGNFSLWISGIYPHYVEARVSRRGAPPLSYYERMGQAGFRRAADSPSARRMGLTALLTDVSTEFTAVRQALNRISDRHLWPGAGDPVSRLLREVSRDAARRHRPG